MHGAERVKGSIALVAGELHRGVELVSRPVGEWERCVDVLDSFIYCETHLIVSVCLTADLTCGDICTL